MPSQRQEDQPTKLRHPDEIDEIFGRANPNPTREGCPSKDVLTALSRRERPLDDPGYVHLTRCSPCYLEVRAMQEARAHQRRWQLAKLAAAAVVVLAVVIAAWLFIPSGGRAAQDVRAELDLRPYAVTRSETPGSNREPLTLPRGRVTLTMLLPVGSEPGAYEVQVLDSGLASQASASGVAEINNYVTTLQTTLDLASVSPGSYQLAIRRSGQEWQLFPAQIR
jgi:hypothetical protein